MNHGISRRKIFLEKSDYEEFLNTLSEIHELWRVEVLGKGYRGFQVGLVGSIQDRRGQALRLGSGQALRSFDKLRTGSGLRTGLRPSVERVVNTVAAAYGIKLEEVVNGRRGEE